MENIEIKPLSHSIDAASRNKIDLKTKPVGSLGIVEDLAMQLCRIQETLLPQIIKPTVLVCAADHGIVAEGVSPYSQDVTWQMVMNFVGGGAAINVLTIQNDINLHVADVGVNHVFEADVPILHCKVQYGSRNMLHECAMTIDECERAMNCGKQYVMQFAAEGCNTIAFGEMGIGNTTPATCILCRLSGIEPSEVTGAGTGLNSEGICRKAEIISKVLQKHGNATDPMSILCSMGGLEIAMMVGGMLAAASQKMVIVVDGFITTSAFMIARAMQPAIADYTVYSHVSDERGHRAMLDFLGAKPLLNLGMRLGEGTGAAMAMPIIRAAANIMTNMSSFDDANVDKRNDI